jgi:hypothetical protein
MTLLSLIGLAVDVKVGALAPDVPACLTVKKWPEAGS